MLAEWLHMQTNQAKTVGMCLAGYSWVFLKAAQWIDKNSEKKNIFQCTIIKSCEKLYLP